MDSERIRRGGLRPPAGELRPYDVVCKINLILTWEDRRMKKLLCCFFVVRHPGGCRGAAPPGVMPVRQRNRNSVNDLVEGIFHDTFCVHGFEFGDQVADDMFVNDRFQREP